MPESQRKLAVVTGASTGIGFELARECAKNDPKRSTAGKYRLAQKRGYASTDADLPMGATDPKSPLNYNFRTSCSGSGIPRTWSSSACSKMVLHRPQA